VSPEVLHIVQTYGYPVLFAAVLFMNAGVPLPGHITYVAAAILSGRGAMSLPLVVLVAVGAAIGGALVGYHLGRRGGRSLVDGYGPRVGLTAPRVARMERFFERHGVKAIVLTRFFVVIRTFGALFAGVNQVPWRRFLLATAAGAVAWGLIFGAAGYVFGERWHLFEDWLGRLGIVGICITILLATVITIVKRRRGSSSTAAAPPPSRTT
jgi:membrane protein DedA with SNARE-associated domain